MELVKTTAENVQDFFYPEARILTAVFMLTEDKMYLEEVHAGELARTIANPATPQDVDLEIRKQILELLMMQFESNAYVKPIKVTSDKNAVFTAKNTDAHNRAFVLQNAGRYVRARTDEEKSSINVDIRGRVNAYNQGVQNPAISLLRRYSLVYLIDFEKLQIKRHWNKDENFIKRTLLKPEFFDWPSLVNADPTAAVATQTPTVKQKEDFLQKLQETMVETETDPEMKKFFDEKLSRYYVGPLDRELRRTLLGQLNDKTASVIPSGTKLSIKSLFFSIFTWSIVSVQTGYGSVQIKAQTGPEWAIKYSTEGQLKR